MRTAFGGGPLPLHVSVGGSELVVFEHHSIGRIALKPGLLPTPNKRHQKMRKQVRFDFAVKRRQAEVQTGQWKSESSDVLPAQPELYKHSG
jgi:hypothetical protein